MCIDSDIKIAGDKPSQNIKNGGEVFSPHKIDPAEKEKAMLVGREVADSFAEDAASSDIGDIENTSEELVMQRRLLLSFTATAGFEEYIKDDALAGFAQKSFLDTLKKKDPELYRSSSDTGAFSFYYLAYRRGSEVERRIGQTFAMLCSHDGDPIYQEMGEALYCWFLSEVRKIIAKYF